TSDLVQGLGITQADAERIKERHGVAYEPLVDPSEMIGLPSTPGQGARQAQRQLVSHVIHQRLEEILLLVSRDLEAAGYVGRLPAGVVLTGGTAHLPGVVELGRDVFALPVRAGVPEFRLAGLVDSVQAPRYAAPVGLALYGARRFAAESAGFGGFGGGSGGGGGVGVAAANRLLAPLKRWLQDFF
ncbi:MAG: cell division FtsA domain-containing protein, partial [Gemmatimonadales bacterium]